MEDRVEYKATKPNCYYLRGQNKYARPKALLGNDENTIEIRIHQQRAEIPC